jgi:uncharacterized protein (TIGR02145 family)
MNRILNKRLLFILIVALLYGMLNYSCKKAKNLFSPGPDIVDIDGNLYHSVIIGNQTWMRENLKVTHYRNGKFIPNMKDSSLWATFEEGARCYYDNDSIMYSNLYGAFYNWYAINDSDNIAPKGWHIPSQTEWEELISYLGGKDIAGNKMKAVNYWLSSNENATNESGFSALPGGYRVHDGSFHCVGKDCIFRVKSLANMYYILRSESSEIHLDAGFNENGNFVRCVKD